MSAADFSFAWEGASGPSGPWSHLTVVRFEGREQISALYRYEIILLAGALSEEVDPSDLIHRRASLRIRTLSAPAIKVIHGVIVEAEEIAAAPEGQLYRVVLMPPVARAGFRRRYRVFLEKTPRQIIESVLSGDPLMEKASGSAPDEDLGLPTFEPAEERFTWRLLDTSRVDSKRARPYCVQYGETDLDFVARLLEEEGISYHVENGAGACLLVLSDYDGGRARLSPSDVIGPGIPGRGVNEILEGARLRSRGVALGEFDWKKPDLAMGVVSGASDDLIDVAYPGGYADKPEQGAPLAKAALERHLTEASFARGDGSLRVLSAGSVVTLAALDADHEGEYLVTSLRVVGEQAGVLSVASGGGPPEPFHAWFECARRGAAGAPEESRFRPARRTPKPRIVGPETAFVTAEPSAPGAEVNVGGPDGLSTGCVRVRFHWDNDPTRHAKEPTSCWVRVSQVFAGAAEGAVWHPRVGVEVIVDYEDGDPDRPIITGRVYNGQNLPHHGGSPAHSTLKSYSTPGGAVWNELSFHDAAGSELFFLNAGKDHTTVVGDSRLEQVASNATMIVGANNTESIGANSSVAIGANNVLSIGANQAISVGADAHTKIGGNSEKTVGANESLEVGASQTINVGSTLTESVSAAVSEAYKSVRTTTVSGAAAETCAASKSVTVASSVTQSFGTHVLMVKFGRFIGVSGAMTTTVGGAVTEDFGGSYLTAVAGPFTENVSAGVTRICPFYMTLVGLSFEVAADKLNKVKARDFVFTGVSAVLTGVTVTSGSLNVTKTGTKASATGLQLNLSAIVINKIAATVKQTAPDLEINGLSLMI